MKKRLQPIIAIGASVFLSTGVAQAGLAAKPEAEPLSDKSVQAEPEDVEEENQEVDPEKPADLEEEEMVDPEESEESEADPEPEEQPIPEEVEDVETDEAENQKVEPEKPVDTDEERAVEPEVVEETEGDPNPEPETVREELADSDEEELKNPAVKTDPNPARVRDPKRNAKEDSGRLEDKPRGENDDTKELEKQRREVEKARRRAEKAAEKGGERGEKGRERAEEARERAEDARERSDDRADRAPRNRDRARDEERLPEVEPAVREEAEAGVREATARVQRELDDLKLNIADERQAQAVIREVLGREGRLSRAEQTRDERFGIRRDFDTRRPERRQDRQDAVTFLSQRLMGQADLGNAPQFFRRPEVDFRDDRLEDRFEDRRFDQRFDQRFDRRIGVREEEVFIREPRYYHEGRRYVPYASRAEIPAILLATAAMNRVRIQPMREVMPAFRAIPEYETTLPPEYRRMESQVVSYPVNAETMLSSNDILFRQGSTSFADEHSYEMLLALEETMKRPELRGETFVIEGHASAEGSFDANLLLSQRRAEAIVRDLVRSGIDPSRLVPVGYGETEADYAADAREDLRRLDRRVVVVKLDQKPVANR